MKSHEIRVGGGGASDLAAYERLAQKAKESEFDVTMSVGLLAEHTADQIGDGSDSWVRFTAGCPGLMKVVETSLVHDVLSKEHIEKNAALVRSQSRILEKYGLKGTVGFLEPMWLPESFYEKHPDLRGARCDNPCLALDPYYSPCLDRDEVLEHYREATRKLLEIAPAIRYINISTNDSGAGICWCTGLYPGPNGPEFCRGISVGERVGKWLEAMLAGAADAGSKIEIIFNPVHFSRDEKYETIERLPERTRFTMGSGNFPNIPFFTRESLDIIERSRKAGRAAVVGTGGTLVPWLMEPVVEMPAPYYILDSMREAFLRTGAEIIAVAGTAKPVDGIDTVHSMAIMSALKEVPKTNAEIEERVLEIAEAHVGEKLKSVLASAWRDVDHALRLWPNNADTNHCMYPKYSIIGDRWLVRPIVAVPEKLTEEEKAYFSKHRHRGRGLTQKQLDSFFTVESTQNYETPEFKWLVAAYDEMMGYMNRAVETLETALEKAIEDVTIERRFRLQYYRVVIARDIWRTQRNVFRCGSIIEFFTGARQDEYWHVIRKDESFLEPGTYRRLFCEAVDDEIDNCREMIQLMGESDVELLSTGDEQSFILPCNLAEQLEKKIAIMEAHKDDVDILFEGCPPEMFTDPIYDWADKNKERTKADREKDRARMKGA
ncbi:MAG: hypothetical protein J7M19_04430 [Planctomycetes bacterium]|nr:hypothetical protein [Planctomycetota bacterium]